MVAEGFFFDRYTELIGVQESKQLMALKNKPVRTVIRVNSLTISDDALVKRLNAEGVFLSKVSWLQHGYYVDSARFSVGAAPEYLQGHYYIQEAAAQLPAEILDPSSGDLVLDMCASPGGKTTQIAAIMQNKGIIIALDLKTRLPALKNNLERMRVSNTIVYDLDARKIADLGLMFDKVLLDAPCSGNFINDPSWFAKRSVDQFKDRAKLQRALISAAVKVLKPRGVIVYSTCSLEPEENEEVVDWALRNLGLKIDRLNLKIGSTGLTNVFGKELDSQLNNCIRFWPHKTGTQGFFVAKLLK